MGPPPQISWPLFTSALVDHSTLPGPRQHPYGDFPIRLVKKSAHWNTLTTARAQ